MLKLAIQKLEQAKPDLADVAATQAARADVERVLTGLSGRGAVIVPNSASLLRVVAKSIEPINNPEMRAAWPDVMEAAMVTENSIRDRQG